MHVSANETFPNARKPQDKWPKTRCGTHAPSVAFTLVELLVVMTPAKRAVLRTLACT